MPDERVSDEALKRIANDPISGEHSLMARECQQSRKLSKYVQHLPGCVVIKCHNEHLGFVGEQPICTCGLAEIERGAT